MSDDQVKPDEPVGRQLQVFLSFAWEDKEVATAVAVKLNAAGIFVWFAEWEIYSGDSLRQKIDAGLGSSSDFVVLLSKGSIKKSWVNQELDGAFVMFLEGKMRLVPLRMGLPVEQLPPLLRGMYSPEVDAQSIDVAQLINDLLGVSRRPPLGRRIGVEAQSLAAPGFSAASSAIAKVFVDNSKTGRDFDPQYGVDELAAITGLTKLDVLDAIADMSGLLVLHESSRNATVRPEAALFSEFDRLWQPWNPADDALVLAADLVNDTSFPADPSAIAARYGWTPRRLNPAIAYLMREDVVQAREGGINGEFLAYRIRATDATRRFVKHRQP